MKKLLEPGSTCATIAAVADVRVLVDGENYYPALCEALKRARRSVCITGWQFDTRANLAPEKGEKPLEFLQFLNALCEANEKLQIFITAWNYSVVYAIEREWFQNVRFALGVHDHIHFRFLDHPETGGAHHVKTVVVDGTIAFTGGSDVCDERWDSRKHALGDSRRMNAHGDAYGPFHDVQLQLTGEVVGPLEDIFWQSWAQAGGNPEDRPEQIQAPLGAAEGVDRERGLSLRSPRVAMSRTRIEDDGCFQIEELLIRVVDQAESSIYIENQYFTSKRFVKALLGRMSDPARPKPQVVIVLPEGGHSKKEESVLGARQDSMLWPVQEQADTYGHQLRVLKSCKKDESGALVATYIHSKVIIVDDHFLSIGSANLMNRSMRVDHELNLSFDLSLCDTADERVELESDIRALKISLLGEHAGASESDPRLQGDMAGLVDRFCADPASKLRAQEIQKPKEDPVLSLLCDPSGPLDWDCIQEAVDALFDLDQTPVKGAARRLGQRLGVVDIDEEKSTPG